MGWRFLRTELLHTKLRLQFFHGAGDLRDRAGVPSGERSQGRKDRSEDQDASSGDRPYMDMESEQVPGQERPHARHVPELRGRRGMAAAPGQSRDGHMTIT